MFQEGITAALRGRRILIVEDDFIVAEDLRQELLAQGAEVLGPVPSVADALELLVDGDRPSAALLDVQLGPETVYPLVEVLRELHIPVVFATAFGQSEMPEAYARLPHCDKPISAAQLIRVLEAV